MELNVGIIGCGAVAQSCHLPAAKRMPNIKIKALADINKEQAETLAERFELKNVSIYTNYLRMLVDADIDAVWILTPPKLHARMVMDSLKHSKHVLCEKPLGISTQETQRIRKALQKMGEASPDLVLMPAHNFIFTPCFHHAKRLIENGRIGQVKKITGYAASNLSFYKAKTDFRLQAKGGVIEDQLPHVIYLCQDVGGPSVKVMSVKPRLERHVVVQGVNVEAELERGVYADLSAAWTGFIPTLRFDIVGESGKIYMDILRRPYNVTVVEDGEKEKIRMGRQLLQYWDVLRGNHPSYLNEHKHFVELVSGTVKPEVTFDCGFELVKTLQSILKVLDERPVSPTGRQKVSVVSVEEDVEAAVREAVILLGGLKIRRGARVVVKPNVCSKKNTEGMIITDPRVLRSVLRMLREKTNNVLVVESDNNSGSGDERVKKTGILDIIEDCGAEFLNLSKDDYEEREVSGLVMRIPDALLEADYLINVPKMKTCNIENAFISIAMKNMFGILADKKKMQLHKELVDVLLYINKTLPQDLVIVDGVIAMEGLGPIWGTPVGLNLIVSGFNPVTVDATCCNIMGINPYAVEVLWAAYKNGVGEIDIDKIEVLGERIQDTRRKFAYPVFLTRNVTGALRTALKTYLK